MEEILGLARRLVTVIEWSLFVLGDGAQKPQATSPTAGSARKHLDVDPSPLHQRRDQFQAAHASNSVNRENTRLPSTLTSLFVLSPLRRRTIGRVTLMKICLVDSGTWIRRALEPPWSANPLAMSLARTNGGHVPVSPVLRHSMRRDLQRKVIP